MLSHGGLASFPLTDHAAFIRRLRMGGLELHEEALAVLERLKARMHVLRDASTLPTSVGRPSIPETSASFPLSANTNYDVKPAASSSTTSDNLDNTTSKPNVSHHLRSNPTLRNPQSSNINSDDPLAIPAPVADSHQKEASTHNSSVVTAVSVSNYNACGRPPIPSLTEALFDDLLIDILRAGWSE